MPLPGTMSAADRLAAKQARDRLAQLVVNHFGATPPSIGPWGQSMIAWDVTGPGGPFYVTLDGKTVASKGNLAVQPLLTTQYHLEAHAGGYTRQFGAATVVVNLTACTEEPVADLIRLLGTFIEGLIHQDPSLSFRPVPVGNGGSSFTPGHPVITFGAGWIKVDLRLEQAISSFPDPSIDITCAFGLEVANGALKAVDTDVQADISVPFYAWLIPGADIRLPIRLALGKKHALSQGQALVDGIAAFLTFVAAPGAGRRVHNVRIPAGNAGGGEIFVQYCPAP